MTKLIPALFILAFAQPSRAQAPADTLRQLDSAWARSYATNDTVLAGKLFDDSLIVTSGNGRLKDKKGEMADVGPSPRISDPLFPHQRRRGSAVRQRRRGDWPGRVVVDVQRQDKHHAAAVYRRVCARWAARVADGVAAYWARTGLTPCHSPVPR